MADKIGTSDYAMRNPNRSLSSIVGGSILTAVLAVVYVSSYFLLMAPGAAVDLDTMKSSFGSSYRYGPEIRVPCQMPGTRLGPKHWTNEFYRPLDHLFRSEFVARNLEYPPE